MTASFNILSSNKKNRENQQKKIRIKPREKCQTPQNFEVLGWKLHGTNPPQQRIIEDGC